MSVRYPSFARRKQVSKQRDRQMASDVIGAVGFVQETTPAVDRPAPPWPPSPLPGHVTVFDLNKWSHPGYSSAAIGPFLVQCGMCTAHPGHFDSWDEADNAQRAHYSNHYEAGETP